MPRRPRDPGLRRFHELWADELAGAALYRALSAAAGDPNKADILGDLAEAEERHAEHWEALLRDGGWEPAPPRIPLRVRVLSATARRFGADAVLPLVLRLEAADADRYLGVAEAPPGMAAQEAVHGKVVAALGGDTAGGRIARSEGRHRTGAAGALRAAVFGVNDGLVSNLSLIMGVAGGTGNNRFVLLAGLAGLLAGAFSMAAGEWISVRSQRELYERELDIEREELEATPEEEREELVLIMRAKGVDAAEAESYADRIMQDADTALDTLAREELGLDPGELVSPWVAAGSSFGAFAVGAFVPVAPFLFGAGRVALAVSIAVSALMLFAVGVSISIFTGRRPVFSGVRMVVVGAVAAAATFGLGKLIGVGVT